MGKSKISIIIAREFAIRVKKKSFIFTTILTPLLFAALMVVPSLIAMYSGGEEGQKIAVVDAAALLCRIWRVMMSISLQKLRTKVLMN